MPAFFQQQFSFPKRDARVFSVESPATGYDRRQAWRNIHDVRMMYLTSAEENKHVDDVTSLGLKDE
jgi:hypothetical protein